MDLQEGRGTPVPRGSRVPPESLDFLDKVRDSRKVSDELEIQTRLLTLHPRERKVSCGTIKATQARLYIANMD